MYATRFVAFSLLLALTPAWAAAVDFSRIERTIAKEPAYATDSPRYFMIALGPEARTRVWVVIDGEVLYVDRDGDGDVTEEGERVAAEKGAFRIGDLPDPHTGRTHTDLVVHIDRRIETSGGTSYIQPFGMNGRLRGKYEFATVTRPAERAAEAPIVHVDGPLQARAFGGDFQTLYRDRDERFSIHFFGRGLDAAIYIYYDDIPEGIYPRAAFVFPAKAAGDEPTKRTVVLKERC